MSKAALLLIISASLSAGVAQGQSIQTPAAPPMPASAGHEVSGIVVQAPPRDLKSCHEHDKDCITAVVAELKLRFPEQLQRWCNDQQDMANRANLQAGDVIAGTQFHGPMARAYNPPEVTKIACAADKKP